MSDSSSGARWAAVIWTTAILAAVAVPGSYVPGGLWAFDKVAHFALFAGFALLWLRAAPGARMSIVVAGLLYGVLTEVGQAVLPGDRTGDPMDALANVLGVLAGALAAWGVGRLAGGSPARRADTAGEGSDSSRTTRPPHDPGESRGP